MLEILTLNGYSRTGKSTVANALVDQGWVEASTSNYLNFKTMDYYKISYDRLGDFLLKNNEDYYRARFMLTTREMKIYVAEEFLVPKYGRYEGLVLPTVRQALNAGGAGFSSKLLISTVNLEEYGLFKQAVLAEIGEAIKWHDPIYLVRDGALPDVDLRKPFGRAIDNNGSLSETLMQIDLLLGYAD